MAKYFITLAATVVFDLTQAIIIGVLFSTALIVVKLTDVDVNISRVENTRLKEIGMGLDHVPAEDEVRVVYLTGTIFFGVVDKLKQRLLTLSHSDVIILSMRGVPVIDLSGVQAFTELAKELAENDTKIVLTSVQPKVMRYFEPGGFIDLIGRKNVYPSAELAIVSCVGEEC